MFEVFISYSSKEQGQAQALCALLEEGGISCWMAPRNIMTGSHWAASIAQAVHNAKLLLLLFSKNAGQSHEVAREIGLAAKHRVAIVPLNLDGSAPKAESSLEYYLSIAHWMDMSQRDLQASAREIVATVRRHLSGQQGALFGATADPLLDIYNQDMDCIGTALRSGVHREGLWHKTFHCWFISHSRGKAYVWFQRRSPKKKDFPGLLDITAGRHLLSGETDREGISKIHLELGVDVPFHRTHFWGTRTYAEHMDGFYNREFNTLYFYVVPHSFRGFALAEEEVSAILRLSAAEGLHLFSGGGSAGAREITAEGTLPRQVSLDDFVPRTDDYYQRVCSFAQEL